MRARVRTLAVLLAALGAASAAAAGAAGARPGGEPGLTDTEILIGGTAPLTGEASAAAAVSEGAQAYFAYLNAEGGVNGRRIVYRVADDAGDPRRALDAVRTLVDDGGVFAIFGTIGTDTNLALRGFLNGRKVPQLFALSGATSLGDAKRYPWTVGYPPPYSVEGAVLGRAAAAARPRGRYAVLYQDDAHGRELLEGLRRGLATRARQIVAAERYAPAAADVQAQVARLRASGADTFFVFAFGKFAVQAFLYANKVGWRPQVYLNASASSPNLMTLATLTSSRRATEGVLSTAYAKDPSDPAARGYGFRLYGRIMREQAPDANPRDAYAMAGMAAAYTLADTLRRAGRNLTRERVMQAATSLNEPRNPFLLDGIPVETSATDRFPIEQMRLARWSSGRWAVFGPLQP